MAKILGGITTSHVPAIGGAIAKSLQQDPYWKPFFDGFVPVRQWIAETRPDTVVVVYNDHGLNFFLDQMPTFAIGCASEYRNADEGWGIPQVPAFHGQTPLSWHLVQQLVDDEFDPVTCQEMVVDHAFTLPMALLWPDQKWPVKVVPVCLNTVQAPILSAKRCWKLGQSLRRGIESWDSDERVLVLGTGGLSHQLDGERAGFINKPFDLQFMDSLAENPTWATQFDTHQLVEQAGTQGIELLMWLTARGMLGERVAELHRNYHIPISNTAAGLMLFEPR
ncbi:MAG: hypothetical protein RIQ53_126 [Pseudomonadota bacterium]